MSEREALERRLAELMPGRLDLALPVAERLATLDPGRLPGLEDLGRRLAAANQRHRALEDAFGGRPLATLAAALEAMAATRDRRSDDEPLLVLAAAELERRRIRQAELRASLAAVPRDDLDRTLALLRQLGELEPGGPDAIEADRVLAVRSRLVELHRRLIAALADPFAAGVRGLMDELAAAPRRFPDSAGILARMAGAMGAARRRRRQRRLLAGALVAAALAILGIGADVALRHRRATAATAGQP